MPELSFCTVCRKHTIKQTCDCTIVPAPVGPMKYSPEDKYGNYRRKAKEAERKAAGIL